MNFPNIIFESHAHALFSNVSRSRSLLSSVHMSNFSPTLTSVVWQATHSFLLVSVLRNIVISLSGLALGRFCWGSTLQTSHFSHFRLRQAFQMLISNISIMDGKNQGQIAIRFETPFESKRSRISPVHFRLKHRHDQWQFPTLQTNSFGRITTPF